MVSDESTTRYFRRVYPHLRGVTRLNAVTRLARLMTEPGRPERIEWVLNELGGEPPRRVLDAGCGQGAFAVELARRGHSVTALDLSGAMLDAARSAAREHRVSHRIKFVQADLRSWSPEAAYDTVLCIGVVEYYVDAAPLVERLYRWSRSRLFLSLTRSNTGPRGFLRGAWLGMHGVRSALLPTHDLERLLASLPGASSSLFSTRWTHCVSVRRRVPQAGLATAASGPATF
jgi:2-polyprenyl-3-methyl-5-hydroxy-6-metoxy-1,4-benzoquinol methylase